MEDYDECDALDKEQTKEFVESILPKISGEVAFSNEDFEACFMEFDQEENGFIMKDKIAAFS